jgi:ribose transport system ATP-binding protein
MATGSSPRIELRGVSKWFGAIRALDGVSLTVEPGEIHVLAGENGAGKSTLIRILSGAVTQFHGELLLEGKAERFGSPAEARAAGIATIHQELSLVESLSVADNLALGTRGAPFGPYLPERARARARELLAVVGLELDPRRLVGELPLGERQLVEVARALGEQARVLIMDEPTSALSESEVELLFARTERLRDQGTAIVFISHRLEEIYAIADRITVLRDGAVVAHGRAEELGRRDLIAAMVGREFEEPKTLGPAHSAEPLLEVRELRAWDASGERAHGVSFTLCRGEILGLTGLRGSGTSDVLRALVGIEAAAGAIELEGRPYRPKDPRAAIRAGMVLVGNDRRLTVFPELNVCDNLTLSSLPRWSRWGFVERARAAGATAEFVKRLGVVAASIASPARTLSGGNQQKVALGRCLLCEPRVLLLDEPTRGIDVGAKAQIHALIRQVAADGLGAVVVSSELDELFILADRVLVLSAGKTVAQFERTEYSRERVLAAAMGDGRSS